MPTPALETSGLGKRFGEVVALRDVDLRVDPGTVHCVLGENGAGKSTLCNLVFGGMPPSAGSMRLAGAPYRPGSPAAAMAAGVAMVHQHFSLVTTMTAEENLLLARPGIRLRRKELRARVAEIADRYGLRIEPDRTVAAMPVGARQKVEIVKALLGDPSLILLDEPTGVLDPAEIDALIATCRLLADHGKAVVLVTHKLAEVARVADAATVLRHGTVSGGGPLSSTGVPALLTAMVGRGVDGLAPGVAATLGLDEVATPTGSDAGPDAAPGHPAATSAQSGDRVPILDVTGLRATRPDGAVALDAADLRVFAGEIVGIAGVEGNGQSELVTLLAGGARPEGGTVRLAGADITTATPAARTALGLGVVPEDRHRDGMVAGMSVAENLFLGDLARFRRFGLLDRAALGRAARAELERFDVRAAGPWALMGSLSGGNQQKVVLARELSVPGLRCLVAAQPTRGLDIGAVDFVLTRLRAAAREGRAVLVVSSEVPELLALCDRVLVAYRGTLRGPVTTADAGAADRIGALMTGVAA
ncbi:ABC transporter ATP-binding protein [Nocardia thailandica]